MRKNDSRVLSLATRTWLTIKEQCIRENDYHSSFHIHNCIGVRSYSNDTSNSQLPAPGAPLRRALVQEVGVLSLRNSTREKQDNAYNGLNILTHPPWKEPESISRLTKALETYKVDLWHGKNCPPGSQPNGDALPFLEDTITHLVGRERIFLLSSTSRTPPSRVRAAAMREALSTSDRVLKSHSVGILDESKNVFSHGNNIKSSLIYQANRIISIVAVVERLVPLTNKQKLSISQAIAQASDRALTPSSAWKALQALLYGCHICKHDVAYIISKHPGLLSNQISIQAIVDCLHLLELDDSSLSDVIRAYPEIFFLDVDKDILPTLAYLSDLGLDEHEMADIVKGHPSVFKPGNASKLQSGVAFWTGKGLSRKSVVNLIKVDPSILETNKQVMQIKVDWLAEHTGLNMNEIASEPRIFSSNLGALIAPRIVFAEHLAKSISEQSNEYITRYLFDMVVNSSLEDYLNYLGSTKEMYDAYIDAWYAQEFIPWLERKSRASEILLQNESEISDLCSDGSEQVALGNFAATKELAWEQQMEREREWHMAWHAWKREQQSLAVAERTMRRHEKRIDTGRNDHVFGPNSIQTDADEACKSNSDCLAGQTTMSAMALEKVSDNKISNVHDLWRQKAIRSNCRSVFFLSRKWTCDSTIDEALTQALVDSQDHLEPKIDFDVDNLTSLSKERVQSCAVSLLLLLRASDYGALEPSVFNAWAARSGVESAELIAAKALISSNKAAFVRSEPSWKYHSVPSKVWLLRDSSFYAPNLLPPRDTRGSRNVSDLAELIYRSLRENHGVPMTRMEISDLYDNRPEFQSKRMRFAIGVLLEQGLIMQRRRKGIASGPMELVLTEPFLNTILGSFDITLI